MVRADDREAPSFLFESVVNGTHNGRYSFVGARPVMEVTTRGKRVVVLDHRNGTRTVTREDDPIDVCLFLYPLSMMLFRFPFVLVDNGDPFRSKDYRTFFLEVGLDLQAMTQFDTFIRKSFRSIRVQKTIVN